MPGAKPGDLACIIRARAVELCSDCLKPGGELPTFDVLVNLAGLCELLIRRLPPGELGLLGETETEET